MNDPNATLHAAFKAEDPYCWLKGKEGYRLPVEWLEALPVPEKYSAEILASFDEPGYARSGAFIMPIFFDPNYGKLTLAEREFIGTVISAANFCTTCLIIHCHKLGEFIGSHDRARRIAVNYRTVQLSLQERAIADYCIKITEQPGRMEASDVQSLRDVGLSDEKIYYVIELAAVFNLTNRMTSGYGMRPDAEFMKAISPPATP